ncbi:MAG: hypothetical protein MUO24_02450 [Desulfobacterales bacterium]|nr:hypothetical protein [Desulfobacterales bacterium]
MNNNPVLIITSFGATKNYPDRVTMRKTLEAFLDSLARQTDENFRLFISHHDRPNVAGVERPWIHWCPLSCNDDYDMTLIPKEYPLRPCDPIDYRAVPYGSTLTDMGRKTISSAMWAGIWAYRQGVRDFWMLRMDSDDLLAKDVVETIRSQPEEIGGVFNRKCHIIDIYSREFGIYDYRYPTTCNALRMKIEGDELKRWFYLCTDHTLFKRHLEQDGILYKEMDWELCITSNSGNSISGRGRIEENKEAEVTPIELTEELIDRYGLDI